MSYKELDEHISDESFDEDYDGENVDESILFDSDFITKSFKSNTCTINENIVQLHHSFGYDCFSKIFNICTADDHTVVYAAGSYIIIFDINNGNLSFRKCAGNRVIGHIAKNPILNHLAVGENAVSPLIVVYEWPSFEVVRVLKGSSKTKINWLTYSQDGKHLCSQGAGPDYILTIWDWKTARIILRTKSHTQDVYVCEFSKYISNNLVSAGSGHIKFWKMANTFTGLKLQGQLGRFGKTEISDVIGILSMADERVISGCQWGNILLWDEELIDIQIMRKGRNPCHSAPIIMFLYSERDKELTSISMDGTIKFWYYRTVEVANPPENDKVVEMEPSFIINIEDSIGKAKTMGMCKVHHSPDSYDYFVQDGNGGIWLVDINVAADAKPPKRLAKFHGDVITSLQASPIGYFIATTSLDGSFHVYDVSNKKLIFVHNFGVPITSLIWLPKRVASSGSMFVIGFQTGILKTVAVPLGQSVKDNQLNLTEVQNSKPHSSSIRHLTVNRNNQVLVCGSDDCTIFVYKIETKPVKLSPIGMYPLPGEVTFIHWKPSETLTALISCSSGHIVEVKIPASRPLYTKESFLLQLESRVIKTVSVKSELYVNQYMRDVERRKREKIEKKKKELKIIKKENIDVEIDEELYFIDSDEDEAPPKVFIPHPPNPVLFAIYTPSEKTLWVSIDGYDAGYLYEYDFEASKPINATIVPDKNNTSMTSIKTIGTDPLIVLMGFADGRVRVTNIKVEDVSDLSNFIEYSIHDNERVSVKLCFSQDNKMLYTYGDDGNIFSFMFQCDHDIFKKCVNPIFKSPKTPTLHEEDIIKTKENLKLSLEARKLNKERRKAIKLANEEKDKTSCLLYKLKKKFKNVLIRNKTLPEPLQFSHESFQFDERINIPLIEEAQFEMDKLHSMHAFEYEKSLLGLTKVKTYFVNKTVTPKFGVNGILKDIRIKTIHLERRHNIFQNLLEEFQSLKHPKHRRRQSTMFVNANKEDSKDDKAETFLRSILLDYKSLPKKVQLVIDQFSARINYEHAEIHIIESEQSDRDELGIDIETFLDDSQNKTGEFNLKTSSDFKPSEDEIISMEDKFHHYMKVQDEIENLIMTFNDKVFELKQLKIQLLQDYKQFKFDVKWIKNSLKDSEITAPFDVPEILIDEYIDPVLIESFEPIKSVVLNNLISYLKKMNHYSKLSTDKLDEKPTYLETNLEKIRIDLLKYKFNCLYECILAKINKFDERLLRLKKERKDFKLRISFLNLFGVQLEEEQIILNDFDLIEDQYAFNFHKKIVIQNEQVNKVKDIREEIEYNKKQIKTNAQKLIDIKRTFDMEVQNNQFANYLRKIFKKKMKTPKVIQSDEDDDSPSSSSSDESDETVIESDKSGESLTKMAALAVFDEKVLPDGCDPKLYAYTFELRSQQYNIEQLIENIKKEVVSLNRKLDSAIAELEITNTALKRNHNELIAIRIKKQLKLNEVKTTILLKNSQINNVKSLKSSILLSEKDLEDLKNKVDMLEAEKINFQLKYKSEKLLDKKLRIEIKAMERDFMNLQVAIKYELKDKFGIENDWNFIDDMEMAIINYMIIEARDDTKEMEKRFIRELKLLENEIKAHEEIFSQLLMSKSIKAITLRSVYQGVLELQQTLSVQHKFDKKFQDLFIDETYTSDVMVLNDVYDILVKRKQDICKEINTLKN